MRRASANIEAVAPATVVDVELRRGARMLHQPLQEADALVLLLHQRLPEQVAEREGAQRADRVDEQRVRTVERVDEPAAVQARPASRLHRAADLQRQLVEAAFPLARVDPLLTRQPPQVSVGADVVEPVIVHAHVREVRRHALDRARSTEFEECSIAGGVELQQRRSELKALRPLGPASCLIAPSNREHRRAVLRTPGVLDRADLRRREIEQPIDPGHQVARRSSPVEAHHFRSPLTRNQFASSLGHSESAGSPEPSPDPCRPSLNTCISAGTPALRSAR